MLILLGDSNWQQLSLVRLNVHHKNIMSRELSVYFLVVLVLMYFPSPTSVIFAYILQHHARLSIFIGRASDGEGGKNCHSRSDYWAECFTCIHACLYILFTLLTHFLEHFSMVFCTHFSRAYSTSPTMSDKNRLKSHLPITKPVKAIQIYTSCNL